MIPLPSNLDEIKLLIQNQVPESIHLDYKASPALDSKKRDEISKDVSAFANSDGGILIYGIEEDRENHLPLQIDCGANPKWNRERFEQVITSTITPKIDGININVVPLLNGNVVVCVEVPQSVRGPHQANDKKYYKRFNFASFPMEHYEIEDSRSRRRKVPPLVSLDLEAPGGGLFEFSLKNIGDVAATDVRFAWTEDMKWWNATPPEQFTRGIKFLAPRKILNIPYYGVFDLLNEKGGDDDPKFDIEVSYFHGETGMRLSESFHFEPADLRGTVIRSSDVETQGREISKRIEDLGRTLSFLSRQLESLLSSNRSE